jgi:hypothetical protein
MFVSLALAALSASAARAKVYGFTFRSSDDALTAAAEITVNGADEVTAISGKISGLVNGVAVNPSFPSPVFSPDGSFTYNNLCHNSGMAFDSYGLLSTTAQNPGGYWNLRGNAPGVYSLCESVGSNNYRIQKTGKPTIAAAPELPTWAMLGLGLAGLGLRRRPRAPRLADRGLA